MTAEILAGLVRHVLTAIGPLIVSFGWVDNDTWIMAAGAASTIVGAGWSVYAKVKSHA